ncbi:MAG: DUF1648 domain-containing protein [Demequinaceae bacterium]|nr:DUF1648 domain-containing protein [Demequinaceae bacterium]
MTDASRDPVVRRFAMVALACPAVFTAISLGAMVAWRGTLPDPVAIHWGGSGGPDGFGSLATVSIAATVLGLGVPALISATTLPMLRRGARGPSFRFMGSIATGISTLSAVLNTWTIAMQRGLADAHDGPSVWPALTAAYAAAIVAGVAAWFFQPRQATKVEGLQHGEPLELGSGERAVWMRTVTLARPFSLLLYGTMGGLGAGAVALWSAGAESAAWPMLATAAFLALLVAGVTTFHVKVDDKGVSVVSALGVPRMGVALADVADAGVAHVNGFAEFGGWGLRQRPGALGVIMRNGESLQVTRRNGKRLVITVDDAQTAAALLLALVERARLAPQVDA